MIRLKTLLAICLMGIVPFSMAIGSNSSVLVLNLFGEVNVSMARYVKNGISEANETKPDYILLHLNTYGGGVIEADSIRTYLLNVTIPTIVFIDKNAGSAGALISLACDSIYMAPGGSIGAATAVSGKDGAAMPHKYQSYMAGLMRATASQNGRNPKIAEKMVDQELELENLSPKGQVLTFTDQEALEHGYSEGTVENMQEITTLLGIKDAVIKSHESSFVETIIIFLINPAVSGLLIILIFGGLFMEMKSPGLGFPGAIALLAASVFFAPHYLHGLAENWEILMFCTGILFIGLEIFVVPGFGITGIIGITCTIIGLGIALLDNRFLDFTNVSSLDALRSFALVLMSMAGAIGLVILIARNMVFEQHDMPFVLAGTQDKADGYTAFDNSLLDFVGKESVTVTDLKPSGYISIDGRRLDAESEGDFLPSGTKVTVLMVRGMILLVRKA